MNEAIKKHKSLYAYFYSRYAISLLAIILFLATFSYIAYWVANHLIYR